MESNEILGSFTGLLQSGGAMIVLCVVLPFAASMILDGVVHTFRGKGLKPLTIAIFLTVGIAIAGVVMRGFATAGGVDDSAMWQSGRMLLTFAIPLALLGFVFRMLSLWLRPARRTR